MLKEYSEYYTDTSTIIGRFGNTLSGIQFDEKSDAVEIFVLQALSMCKYHCRAISILLDNDFFTEPIMVSRSLFELLFDVQWIIQPANPADRLERAYQLESHPYYEVSKEVKRIERDVASADPIWSKAEFTRLKSLLEEVKKDSPFLVRTSSDGSVEFKQAPNLLSRMGDELGLRYYHLYRFTSLFTHPTPALKQVYLKLSGTEQTHDDIIEGPLKSNLAYGLLLVEFIMTLAIEVLRQHNPEQQQVRDVCLSEMVKIVGKGNKGYFGT